MDQAEIAILGVFVWPWTKELSHSLVYRVIATLVLSTIIRSVVVTVFNQFQDALNHLPLLPLILVLGIGLVAFRIYRHINQSHHFQPH